MVDNSGQTLNLFRGSKLDIDVGGQGWLLFSAKDYRTARALARALGTHEGHFFRPGDESMFRVYVPELRVALEAVGLQEQYNRYLSCLLAGAEAPLQ
jgi:hypothetical protein